MSYKANARITEYPFSSAHAALRPTTLEQSHFLCEPEQVSKVCALEKFVNDSSDLQHYKSLEVLQHPVCLASLFTLVIRWSEKTILNLFPLVSGQNVP